MSQNNTTAAKKDNAPPVPVAALKPSRLPIVGSVAKEFDVTADQWRVLVDQIFPNALSVEAVGMALAYCRARKLDIYKKPVHIVPMYSTALKRMVETVWPSIAEIRTTAHRTGEYAGIDEPILGPMVEQTFEHQYYDERTGEAENKIVKTVRYPEWASVVVWRVVQGQRCAFHAKIWWLESYATTGKTDVPNEMWAKRSIGQLLKCVEAAALRMAFPEELGNTYAAEEMEGKTIDGTVAHAAPASAAPAAPAKLTPPPPDDEPAPKPPVPDAPEPETFTNPEEPDASDPDPGSDEWFTKLEQFAGNAKDQAELVNVHNYFELDDVDNNAPLDVSARAQKIMDAAKTRIERASLEAAGQRDMLADLPEETRNAVRNAGTP